MTPASIRTTGNGSDRSLQETVADAGLRLRSALEAMLAELSHIGTHEQSSIQSALNLSQSATSRLMAGARSTDPLAVLARVPGPEGLRKMLPGAARAGVTRECLMHVEAAVSEVESLINGQVGDRHLLDALLSDWVHESRASFEMRQRAAAFKAMSALRGVQIDASAACWILHPSSDDPALYDAVQIDALHGCRRIRPNAALHATTRNLETEAPRVAMRALNDQVIETADDILLHEFCALGEARMRTERCGTVMQTLVENLPLGKNRGANLVSAVLHRGRHRAARAPEGSRTTGVAAHVEPPTQTLILDVLLHERVWPGVKPELLVFDTVVRGLAHPEDPARQADRLDVPEPVVFLGHGLGAFRVVEIPDYTRLINDVCRRVGWDSDSLRGYRVKMRYPIYGSQVCLAFEMHQ